MNKSKISIEKISHEKVCDPVGLHLYSSRGHVYSISKYLYSTAQSGGGFFYSLNYPTDKISCKAGYRMAPLVMVKIANTLITNNS